jgi:hypothetical protein
MNRSESICHIDLLGHPTHQLSPESESYKAYIVATLGTDSLDESVCQEQFVILAISLIFGFQPEKSVVVQVLKYVLRDPASQLVLTCRVEASLLSMLLCRSSAPFIEA